MTQLACQALHLTDRDTVTENVKRVHPISPLVRSEPRLQHILLASVTKLPPKDALGPDHSVSVTYHQICYTLGGPFWSFRGSAFNVFHV